VRPRPLERDSRPRTSVGIAGRGRRVFAVSRALAPGLRRPEERKVADPEVRAFPDGNRVANFTVATNDYRGKGRDEKTNWHRVAVFGNLVDVVEQYVKKGDRILVFGEIDYSTTEDEKGVRYWTTLRVRDLTLLGSPKSGGEGTGYREYAETPTGDSDGDSGDSGLPF